MHKAPSSVMMVRPAVFGYNPETAESNAFQKRLKDARYTAEKALEEFDGFVTLLRSNELDVHVFQDPGDQPTPDSVFPNNWVSFHPDGKCIAYPMMSPLRRNEKRLNWANTIGHLFGHHKYIDLSHFETKNQFLEGTGSLIFDHPQKKVYCCLSERSHIEPLHFLSEQFDFTPITFHAFDRNGKAVYHTNVMLSIGERFAVIALETISDLTEKNKIKDTLLSSGKDLIEISTKQMEGFAGNLIQLRNLLDEPLIILSATAESALSKAQKNVLKTHGRFVVGHIPTIESAGGGSVRCMMATIEHPE